MTLRILQIDSGVHPWDGTLRYVTDISAALGRRGHRVTIACPPGSIQAQFADDHGFQKFSFEMGGSYDWTQLPGFVRAVAGKYDVVHIHKPRDYLMPAVGARIARVPVTVMTRHLAHPFSSRRNAYICASLLYDRIIAVSPFVRNVMVDSGAQPERIEVVPNGTHSTMPDPEARLRLRKEFSIPRDAVLVAAAGRISPQKGFDVLIRAVHWLMLRGVVVYCVIFGAGAALTELRALAASLGLEGTFRLPGFRKDVDALWCAADIAAVPSLCPESFGYVALEALSAGCPVVASRVGGLQDVVSSDSAILTEPGHVEGLASAMQSLVASPELRSQMRQAATRRAETFTLDANVTNVERIYTELLQRRQSAQAIP